jgi:hypothetical protein
MRRMDPRKREFGQSFKPRIREEIPSGWFISKPRGLIAQSAEWLWRAVWRCPFREPGISRAPRVLVPQCNLLPSYQRHRIAERW